MGPYDILVDLDRATTGGWVFTVEREQQSPNTRLRYEVTMIHDEKGIFSSRATSLKGAFAKVLMKWADADEEVSAT